MKQPTAQKSIESVLQRNDIGWATVYLLPQKTTLSNWCKECLTLPTLEPSTAILGFWNVSDKESKLINYIRDTI